MRSFLTTCLFFTLTACSVHIPTASLTPQKSDYHSDNTKASEKYRSHFMQQLCIGMPETYFNQLTTARAVRIMEKAQGSEKHQTAGETYYVFNDYLDTIGLITYRAVFIQGRLARYEYYAEQEKTLTPYLAISIENTFWKAVPMPMCRTR